MNHIPSNSAPAYYIQVVHKANRKLQMYLPLLSVYFFCYLDSRHKVTPFIGKPKSSMDEWVTTSYAEAKLVQAHMDSVNPTCMHLICSTHIDPNKDCFLPEPTDKSIFLGIRYFADCLHPETMESLGTPFSVKGIYCTEGIFRGETIPIQPQALIYNAGFLAHMEMIVRNMHTEGANIYARLLDESILPHDNALYKASGFEFGFFGMDAFEVLPEPEPQPELATNIIQFPGSESIH